ncbi:MAG: TIGR00297 family protein [Haloferacaceae archaeon]
MTTPVRRAGGFAVVGTLALAAPALGRAAALPFAAVALGAAFVVDDGPLFELFARPGDEQEGRLAGLAGFALAAAGLALLATLPRGRAALPVTVYVAAVLVVAYGNLGERLVGARTDDPFLATAGFATVGFVAALGGQVATALAGTGAPSLPRFAFLAAAGALAAALLRAMLFVRDDPLVMLTVGVQLWLFETVATDVHVQEVAVALGVTVVLGYASYALGTASVPGMLTGVLLGLLTIVLGGYGWFALLVAFFAVGGLSTKFRYERKRERGVAEENEGARGTGNVLGNAAVALVAVIGYAAVPQLPVDATVFRFAFAGSLAAAMSDTLSSEVGGLYDTPRLITTLDPVPPGTDGGVTWQGTLVGAVGAALVAGVAALFLPDPRPLALTVVAAGGVVGMLVDSFLGATVEGDRIGNQGVNLLATLGGALASVGLAAALL